MKDIEVISSLLGSPYFFQEKWACETLYCSSMRSIFDHCDYKVYTKTIVNKHKPTKQEEWIHLCDYKVLTKTVLKKHKVSMHEGVG